jgi:hypothetical protein
VATSSFTQHKENIMGIEQYIQEAEAVVDFTEPDPDLRAEPGAAFSGDLDRRYLEDSIWASAQIGNYARLNADGEWEPSLELTVEAYSIALAKASGLHIEDADEAIRSAMAKANTKNSPAQMGRVSLDLTPDVPGRPQDLLHPTQPMVVFLTIKPGSFLYRENRRGMAVWFMPNTAADGAPLDAFGEDLTPYNGRYYADTRFIDGYGGVLEFFGSHRLLREAADELTRAVKIAATPRRNAETTHGDPGAQLQAEMDKSDAAASKAKRLVRRRLTSPF